MLLQRHELPLHAGEAHGRLHVALEPRHAVAGSLAEDHLRHHVGARDEQAVLATQRLQDARVVHGRGRLRRRGVGGGGVGGLTLGRSGVRVLLLVLLGGGRLLLRLLRDGAAAGQVVVQVGRVGDLDLLGDVLADERVNELLRLGDAVLGARDHDAVLADVEERLRGGLDVVHDAALAADDRKVAHVRRDGDGDGILEEGRDRLLRLLHKVLAAAQRDRLRGAVAAHGRHAVLLLPLPHQVGAEERVDLPVELQDHLEGVGLEVVDEFDARGDGGLVSDDNDVAGLLVEVDGRTRRRLERLDLLTTLADELEGEVLVDGHGLLVAVGLGTLEHGAHSLGAGLVLRAADDGLVVLPAHVDDDAKVGLNLLQVRAALAHKLLHVAGLDRHRRGRDRRHRSLLLGVDRLDLLVNLIDLGGQLLLLRVLRRKAALLLDLRDLRHLRVDLLLPVLELLVLRVLLLLPLLGRQRVVLAQLQLLVQPLDLHLRRVLLLLLLLVQHARLLRARHRLQEVLLQLLDALVRRHLRLDRVALLAALRDVRLHLRRARLLQRLLRLRELRLQRLVARLGQAVLVVLDLRVEHAGLAREVLDGVAQVLDLVEQRTLVADQVLAAVHLLSTLEALELLGGGGGTAAVQLVLLAEELLQLLVEGGHRSLALGVAAGTEGVLLVADGLDLAAQLAQRLQVLRLGLEHLAALVVAHVLKAKLTLARHGSGLFFFVVLSVTPNPMKYRYC
eukprot:Rhum_TRINITY_DN14606_c21_g1::Rhum_TRINITY_DN14606_c21_g1_i1::g.104212::m.104212